MSQTEIEHSFSIRPAQPGDAEAIERLFPRLADFEVPARRTPKELWQGDRALFLAWLEGTASDVLVSVAVDVNDDVMGVVMIKLCDDFLNHTPSAHLEVIAISRAAQGCGLGGRLMQEAERLARSNGALSLSLHVFANNHRARHLYQKLGYDGELIRYIKALDP